MVIVAPIRVGLLQPAFEFFYSSGQGLLRGLYRYC